MEQAAPPISPEDLPHWPWSLQAHEPPAPPSGGPDISWLITDRPAPRPVPFRPSNDALAALIQEGPPPGRTIVDEPEIAPYQRRSALGVTLSAGVGSIAPAGCLTDQFLAAEARLKAFVGHCAACGAHPRPFGTFLCDDCRPVCVVERRQRTKAERDAAVALKYKILRDADRKRRGKPQSH
jgi:hypothetical protein